MYSIDAQELTKTYQIGEVLVEALRGVSLTIEQGGFLAIMGPSGSGKSTLLYLLGGIETPSSGRVLLEGVDIAALDDNSRTKLRRQRIGFIFQSFNLFPTLSAVENVALPLRLDGVPKAQARDRAKEVLAMVGMEHRGGHVPGALSGGEQQRVAIARALVIRPAVLLADEPTGNLDSASGQQVKQTLRNLADQYRQTIVVVTHDESVAAAANSTVRLRDGLIDATNHRPTAARDFGKHMTLEDCL
jgi:putative ABC transport system ATP-binding protein